MKRARRERERKRLKVRDFNEEDEVEFDEYGRRIEKRFKDFVKQNVENSQQFVYENEKRQQDNRQKSAQRHFEAKEVREIEAALDYRLKLLSLQKWDFLRQERRKKEEMVEERLRQRRQMHKILILAKTYDVIKQVRKKFDERCEKIRI